MKRLLTVLAVTVFVGCKENREKEYYRLSDIFETNADSAIKYTKLMRLGLTTDSFYYYDNKANYFDSVATIYLNKSIDERNRLFPGLTPIKHHINLK